MASVEKIEVWHLKRIKNVERKSSHIGTQSHTFKHHITQSSRSMGFLSPKNSFDLLMCILQEASKPHGCSTTLNWCKI